MVRLNPLIDIVIAITSFMPRGVGLLYRYLFVIWFSITLVGVLIGVISIIRRTLGFR